MCSFEILLDNRGNVNLGRILLFLTLQMELLIQKINDEDLILGGIESIEISNITKRGNLESLRVVPAICSMKFASVERTKDVAC